jgi:hypothetical protein
MATVYTRYDVIGRIVRMTKHLLREEYRIYVGAKLVCVADNIGDAYRFYNRVV